MYRTVFFEARNKDNKNVDGFKRRTASFLTDKSKEELLPEFLSFVEKGQPGEMCRFYEAVNYTNLEKVNKELVKFLVDNLDYPPHKVISKLASLGAKAENLQTKKWLFDFDDTKEKLEEFLKDLQSYMDPSQEVSVFNTVTGYSVVVSHGFDCRELLTKYYSSVELKRYGDKLVHWATKE